VIGNAPVCVGVPERTPEEESASPDGSVPLASENTGVPIAPVCVNVWLNGVPAVLVLTDGLPTVMALQQEGSADSPAGSEGAAGNHEPVVIVGNTPTAGPLVGKVVPEIVTVPHAASEIVPWLATPEAPAPTGRTSPRPSTQITLPE